MENMLLLSSREANQILRTAIKCSSNKLYTIAQKSGINTATLYSWNSDTENLSGKNYDRLLDYFVRYEASALNVAAAINGYYVI